MKTKLPWVAVIKAEMQAQGVSERALASAPGITRSTLRNCMAGTAIPSLAFLETMLAVFGHGLAIIPLQEATLCQSVPQESANVAKPSPMAPDAHAGPKPMPNAKRGLINLDRLRVKGATAQHGTKHGQAT